MTLLNNYPTTRKPTKPWLHEQKFKCPKCNFKSIEKVVRYHYERIHVLQVLRQLIFDNPCIGCLNPDKEIKKLNVYDYTKLCMTHRNAHDEVFG